MISVTIVDDEVDEENELLFSMLQLKSELSNVKVVPHVAMITIVDDDRMANLYIVRLQCS